MDVNSVFGLSGTLRLDGAYRLYRASDKWGTASEIAGGWAGGMAASAAFSAWFLPADTAGSLAWLAHGIGAITAFAMGYASGSDMGNRIYKIMFPYLPSDNAPQIRRFWRWANGWRWSRWRMVTIKTKHLCQTKRKY